MALGDTDAVCPAGQIDYRDDVTSPFLISARSLCGGMETLSEIYLSKVAAGELTSDPAQLAILPQLERISRALMAPEPKRGFFRKSTVIEAPKGLYLWGGVGRGKSMLMDMFVDHLDIPGKRRVHFHAFMQEVHAALHEARKTGVEDAIVPVAVDIAKGLKVLAFDEMQITDITDAMIVGRLFDKLHEVGVAIITTSNRVPDDLYKNGLNRNLFLPFIELIKTRLDVVEIISENDYRQNRLKGERVWFSPVSSDTRAAMDVIWQDLTAGKAEQLILMVKGREVEIPGFYNGVARASFFDLCGRFLGAGDYLALVENARVLLLDDVPQLGRTNFNEAKRFVTLVDALYEAKVRLIVSAAAEPEMLYIEGEGSFEFERTASRLREMQDETWGVE